MIDPLDVPLIKRRGPLEIPDVEQPAKKYAERNGWLFEKVKSLSRRGWPDRLLVRRGLHVWVEFKRPGQKPTAQQAEVHEDMRKRGMIVKWFNTLESFKAWIDDQVGL